MTERLRDNLAKYLSLTQVEMFIKKFDLSHIDELSTTLGVAMQALSIEGTYFQIKKPLMLHLP